MNANEVTVQLARVEAEFLEVYAKEHATSVAEMVTRYARRFQSTARRAPHPENVKFTGSVPADVDVREEYRKTPVCPLMP
jgi:hypothetical protein